MIDWSLMRTAEEQAREAAATKAEAARAAVDAERDRRLAAGFVFEGRRYDCDPVSKTRIAGAATLAGFALGMGARAGDVRWHGGPDPFMWIAADNAIVEMDAPTCFAFGRAAAAHEAAHVFAGRALKDAPGGPPADLADDRWWPA